jgi:cardiolipin synthase
MHAFGQKASQQTADAFRAMDILFYEGNSVTVLPTGSGKYDALFADIERARRFVHLDYFKFQNDSICHALFDLLARKAAQGVEVRIVFDSFGNSHSDLPLPKSYLKELRALGIQIYPFSRVRFPWVSQLLHRDHHKIALIDGEMAYTGGMNVADYYLHGKPRVGEWRDMHMKVVGSVVDGYEHIFEVMWYDVSGELLDTEQSKSTVNVENGISVALVNRVPLENPEVMRDAYAVAIDNAQRLIQIVNPYATLVGTVKKALQRALQRGVKLQIMVSSKCDVSVTPCVVAQEMRRLMKRGAEVYYFDGGFHHSKYMTIDGEFCTIGTANLDGRSLCCDYEVNAFIFDREVTHELEEVFRKDRESQCTLLTPENWKQKFSWRQRFSGRFLSIIKNML